MQKIEIVGLLAGFCASYGYIPQFVKLLKLKDSSELSIKSYLLWIVAAILWLTYGISIHSFPMILWNVFILICASATVFVAMKYRKKNGDKFSINVRYKENKGYKFKIEKNKNKIGESVKDVVSKKVKK